MMVKPLTNEIRISFYKEMCRIRRFEEVAIDMFRRDKIYGLLHSYIGEEPIAVGVEAHLCKEDYVAGTHRSHGHALAKGMHMDRMMAELFGRQTGYNKGKGGSMHIADLSQGMLSANGIVGGGIGIAVGAAFSAKYRKTNTVAITYLGDGAINRSTFHECINLASVWDLPCVFVVENNNWAITMPSWRSSKVDDLSLRAAGYGIPGVSVDGTSVEDVYYAAGEAIDRARAGKGPTLLVCKATRHKGHQEGDNQDYRPPEELAACQAIDGFRNYREFLLSKNFATIQEIESIDADVEKEIQEAVEFATNSPFPKPEDALKDLFGGQF
jgi:TPP-dependent pyruvate/acetoin dehydrogenase alpha subunit